MKPEFRPVLWLFYVSAVITAVLALWSLSFRWVAEESNRAVGVAVESDVVRALSAQSGMGFQESLERLQRAGANMVILSERTLGEMLDEGRVRFEGNRLVGEPAVLADIERSLLAYLGVAKASPSFDLPTEVVWPLDLPWAQIRSFPIGLDPDIAAAATTRDIEVVARHSPYVGAAPFFITETIGNSAQRGARYFLPSGDSVLGYRDLEPILNALRLTGIIYCTPEFVRIMGDGRVKAELPGQTVRLHSAQQAELIQMGPREAVERYVRAAKERNIRILLVRPLTLGGAETLDSFAEFIAGVNRGLAKEGMEAKTPRPFDEPSMPLMLPWLIGLSALGATLFCCHAVFSGAWRTISALLLTILFALAGFVQLGGAPEGLGFLAALAFPIAAYVWFTKTAPKPVWLDYLVMIAIALVGGLAVAGVYNSIEYMIGAEQFTGVKVAHFLPVLLIGIYLLHQKFPISEISKNPIQWGQAALFIIAISVLLFLIERTGNDNPAAVSGMELRFRALLDQYLPVRPRTKEFLIGNPALLVGLGLWGLSLLRTENGATAAWGVALLTVGAIGLTSIVNTLCHFHSPLSVNLMRILIGAVVGLLIGGGLWLILRRATVFNRDS
ncbi:MAG: DUF5693 family protein [Fimbriimonadaceae bacterium]